MTEQSLSDLLSPASVAVVGASPRETTTAHRIIRNLITGGFQGKIYPINPRYEDVLGLNCYASVLDLPEIPRAVFISVAAERALDILEQCAECGVPAAFINAGGFDEGGVEGAKLQKRITDIGARSGMAICGPNNMGIINAHDSIYTWTASKPPKITPGPIAFISQSGSMSIAISEHYRALKFAYLITAGNEAVCGAAEYLDAVVRDDRVTTVLMFLETIRNPEKFGQAAQEAARRGKRIAVLKVGRTDEGQAAVAAHTGALSGQDDIYDAYFRHHGIIRVDDLDELVEAGLLLSQYPTPPKLSPAIAMTVSGGESALTADIGGPKGLTFDCLPSQTVELMRPAFPDFSNPGNPLDVWGLGWDKDRFEIIFDAVHRAADVGVLICCIDAPAAGGTDVKLSCEMAEIAVRANGKNDKKILFVSNTAGDLNTEVASVLEPAGIPYLSGLRPALAVIAAWTTAAPTVVGTQAATAFDATALQAAASEPEQFGILRQHNLAMIESVAVKTQDDAIAAAERCGYPVVLKGTAPTIPHKTEHDLIALDLRDSGAVQDEFHRLKGVLDGLAPDDPGAAVVVQPMIGDGIQLILGVRNDTAFGSIIVVGLGGTLTEVLNQASLRIGPVSRETAAEMLAETAAARLLQGVRGKGPYEFDAAVDAIVAFSRLGANCRDLIKTIEINPLIVREQERGVIGVDLAVEYFDASSSTHSIR